VNRRGVHVGAGEGLRAARRHVGASRSRSGSLWRPSPTGERKTAARACRCSPGRVSSPTPERGQRVGKVGWLLLAVTGNFGGRDLRNPSTLHDHAATVSVWKEISGCRPT
jgi:hypothetical protein